MLLKLWFTTSYHRNPWYLGKVVKQIDDICCKIRPPDEITRTLRSIESTLKYWKGYLFPTNIIYMIYMLTYNYIS